MTKIAILKEDPSNHKIHVGLCLQDFSKLDDILLVQVLQAVQVVQESQHNPEKNNNNIITALLFPDLYRKDQNDSASRVEQIEINITLV